MTKGIVSDFVNYYWAPDGLARLDKDDRAPPFMGFVLPTVKNENGILFLSEIVFELKRNDYDFPEEFLHRCHRALDYIRVGSTGCFHRRPGQVDMMNSHDNMIGVVLLAQILGNNALLEDIDRWGRTHLWNFNNIKINQLFSFRAFLLPRDQALIRLSRGRFPGVLSSIWLMASIWTKSKHKRMMKLRHNIVRLSPDRWWKKLIMWWLDKWWARWGGDQRFALETQEYYQDPENPYRRLCNFTPDIGENRAD